MTMKSGVKSNDLKVAYHREFNFISNLFNTANLPAEKSSDSDSEDEGEELRDEIEEKNKKTKYKNRIKKLSNKAKKIQRVAKDAVTSTSEKSDVKIPKPLFNGSGNLVFSKFDFLGETSTIVEKDILTTRDTGNKKRILDKFEKKKNYVNKLEEVGQTEKADKIKEDMAWKNMFKKAEGLKVKDDEVLLKKSVAKKQVKKKVSQKKWKERVKAVEKQKIERQKKRTENISKRVQEKKKKKMKKAAKKGRFIPNV